MFQVEIMPGFMGCEISFSSFMARLLLSELVEVSRSSVGFDVLDSSDCAEFSIEKGHPSSHSLYRQLASNILGFMTPVDLSQRDRQNLRQPRRKY